MHWLSLLWCGTPRGEKQEMTLFFEIRKSDVEICLKSSLIKVERRSRNGWTYSISPVQCLTTNFLQLWRFLLNLQPAVTNYAMILFLNLQVVRHVPSSEYGFCRGPFICCPSNTHGSGESFFFRNQTRPFFLHPLPTQLPLNLSQCLISLNRFSHRRDID